MHGNGGNPGEMRQHVLEFSTGDTKKLVGCDMVLETDITNLVYGLINEEDKTIKVDFKDGV